MSSAVGGPCCVTNLSDVTSNPSPGNVTELVVSHSETVLLVVTIILAINTVISLLLNILLVLIIQYSPSLRAPPNSHLLSICVNNLLLCLDMFLCTLCLNFNSVQMTVARTEALSGIQLFLTYNSLVQYWGTFASIGYYRYKTIKKPSLSLRCRRKLVSRCVLVNWVVSSLLGLTLSLSYSQNSRYATSTLDPFMRDFIATEDEGLSQRTLVAVTLITLLTFLFGLGIIITAYYSICRTLNMVSVVSRNRISPRQMSPNIESGNSDLTLAVGRPYRPQYTLSTPSYLGTALTSDHKEIFTVIFSKNDSSVSTSDFNNFENRDTKENIDTEPSNFHMDLYAKRRQLTPTNSSASGGSMQQKTREFTDISIGADLLRFQKQQSYSISRRHSFRRETISLSNAIRNSLAMLIVYLTCSLPLIILTIPGSAWALGALQRLHLLLSCRLLFYLNAAAYPLWYMGCSVTVKKCFVRLWEAVGIRLRSR